MIVEDNGLIVRGPTFDRSLDAAPIPEELVKLVVAVMGYAAEIKLRSSKKRIAEKRDWQDRGVKLGRERA